MSPDVDFESVRTRWMGKPVGREQCKEQCNTLPPKAKEIPERLAELQDVTDRLDKTAAVLRERLVNVSRQASPEMHAEIEERGGLTDMGRGLGNIVTRLLVLEHALDVLQASLEL